MINSARSRRGMVTSPHHLASQAGLSVLRDGGNAIEAAVAVAATLGVAYPHMIGLGGDSFWMVAAGAGDPLAIDACGAAGSKVVRGLYRGKESIPLRGPLAAITVPGAVSGWAAALDIAKRWGGTMPLARLLEEAIHYAEAGVPVSEHQSNVPTDTQTELSAIPGFAETYMPSGAWPKAGDFLKQTALGKTLRRLADGGLDDFYRGNLATSIAADLARAGSALVAEDLARHRATEWSPLSIVTSRGQLFNFPPPTQGMTSLMILGIFDRLGVSAAEGFDHLHGLIEATKIGLGVRNCIITDPGYMKERVEDQLTDAALGRFAARIDRKRAMPWRDKVGDGDTAWMGVIDGSGRAVSHIQSLFHPFGSGVVLRDTGIVWQNRGIGFSLDESSLNPLMPNRKPFHTLNPAMARLTDGRLVTYGSMGAHGQPQFQAAVFSRYAWFGQSPQQSVTAPRFLVDGDALQMEARFDSGLLDSLRNAGHQITLTPPFASALGHAGLIARRVDGTLEGATDPRSDGSVAAF